MRITCARFEPTCEKASMVCRPWSPLGVDVVEILEFERPKLWVRRLEYPKYKLPGVDEPGITQAARQPSLILGGSFGFGIGAEVSYNKFALHVPLYGQQV